MKRIGRKEICTEQVNKSGISLDNELRIKAYTGKINNVYVWAIQCILIFLASIFPVYTFINSFKLKVNTPLILIIALVCVIINYIAFMLLKIKDKSIMAIGLVFVYVVYFIIKTDEIGRELINVVSKYLDYINYNYNLDYMLILEIGQNKEERVSNLVLILLLFIIMVITYNIVMGFNKMVYFICTAPWPLLCFFVGVTPSIVFFTGYVCITIVIWYINITIKNYKLDEDEIKNKKGKKLFKDIVMVKVCICIFIGYMLTLIVFSLVFSRNKYEEAPIFKNLGVEMHTYLNNTVKKLQGIKVEESNYSLSDLFKNRDVLGNGKISESGTVRFTGKKMFTVVSNRITDKMYLKNYIGFKYNNGWISEPKDVKNLALNKVYENMLTSTLLESDNYGTFEVLPYNMICIKDLDVKGAVDLIPYGQSVRYSILENGTLRYDNHKKNMVVAGYEVEFCDIYALAVKEGLLDDINTSEIRDISIYMGVPEELQGAIYSIKPSIDSYINIVSNNSNLIKKYGEYGKRLEIIRGVINYLNNEYEYTLSPGAPSKDLDPVEYFLMYNKKGYCMYYAAAATAILRNYGIPTRYVEGYIINNYDLEKSKEVDNLDYTPNVINMDYEHHDFAGNPVYEYAIKDKNGHAWVEVYLDNLGWIPVEVTSSRLADEELINKNKYDDLPNKDVEPSSEPVSTTEPKSTMEPDSSAKPTKGANTPKPSESPSKEEKSEEINTKEKVYDEKVIIGIYVLIILFTGFMGIVCIKVVKIKKHVDKYKHIIQVNKLEYIKEVLEYIFAKKDIAFNNSIKYEEYAEKISNKYKKYTKDDIEIIIQIVLKQKYSNAAISDEELGAVVKFYNDVVDDYIMDMNRKDKLYECIIKNYIQKL